MGAASKRPTRSKFEHRPTNRRLYQQHRPKADIGRGAQEPVPELTSGHFQYAKFVLVRCVCPEPEADMRRREFVTLVGGAAVSWPITSHARQSDKTRLIGVLMGYAESDRTARSEVAALRAGLAKLGWTKGSNL